MDITKCVEPVMKKTEQSTHKQGCMLRNTRQETGGGSKKFRNLPRRVSRLQGVVDGSEKIGEFLNESTKKTAFSSAA
jgi:hypothetical protein